MNCLKIALPINLIKRWKKLNEERKALQKSKHRLKEAQEIAKIGHWEVNLESNLSHWSSQIYRILGLKPREIEATHEEYLNRVHPQDRAYLDKTHKEALVKKIPYNIDYRLMLTDNVLKWVNERGQTQYDDMGHPVCSIGTVQDITERKQAEEALKQSEKRYLNQLESNPDPVIVYDKEGKVDYFNPAFTQVFGWTLDECVGKRMEAFEPEEIQSTTKSLEDKVKAGRRFSGVETRRYAKKGDIIPVSISGSVYRDRDGNPIGSIITLRDISENKEIEAKFQQAQKMEAIGVLAGGVAHDFNNILGIIIGNADIALMQDGLNDVLKNNIKNIRMAGQRGATLTRQLLAFCRKQIIQPEILHLNILIAEIEKMLRSIVGEHIEIITKLDSKLWLTEIDPGQMEQVIINLTINARDAMGEGGKLTLETSNMDIDEHYMRRHGIRNPPGPYVMLAVCDTGVGMDKEVQKRIFEPFFTTKRRGKGTGLGLSTIYGIVKQNDGVCLGLQ